MVRIFILKASVKKEACGKLYVSVGVPEDYSRRLGMLRSVFLNRRHWLVSSNRVTTEEKRREEKRREEKESEHLDQRPLFLIPPPQSAEQLSVIL